MQLVSPPAVQAHGADALSQYCYEDTKQLVLLVNDAARLIRMKGEAAFAHFAIKGSKWLSGNTYLFVYRVDGLCMFNGDEPDLAGRNMLGLRDLNGKPVIRYITDIGRDISPTASGWVFYLWQDGRQLSPVWKSAYIRKVIAPDGTVYLVGSGLYDIKIEKTFVQQEVDRAVALLQADGEVVAFKAFLDPASPFNFLQTYIFVLDDQGRTLVDPSFPNAKGRQLVGFRDAVGMKPIAELLGKLAHSDSAWIQYLWPQPGESLPSRKVIYARKVVLGQKTVIVGSDFFLATPIWMRP